MKSALMKLVPPRKKGRAPEERFFDFCMPEPNSGCWLWLGGLSGSGYGRFNVGNREQVQAHRFSWELHYGQIPDDLFACHKCDVRCCVNPEHLFLGTQSDNLQDMVRKGRNNTPFGEQQCKARFTEAQIEAIRLDSRRLRIIGEEYGVDRSYVWHIKRGKYWKHSFTPNAAESTRRERGHAFKAHGELHPKAKLTEQAVRIIRTDPRRAGTVAKEYGVAKRTVQSIRRRITWKHVL